MMRGEPLRRPAELDALDLERSAVIEASAGTGKTYLLEHLVLELLITGRARLEEILIVTFTERATGELVSRIRRKIDQALEQAQQQARPRAPGGSQAPSALPARAAGGWSLDPSARARLMEARQSFDQATIATIHSFCQRVLNDEPLATGRLLGQTQVDGRQVFGDAFRDVLRRELARDAGHAAYLRAFLGAGRDLDALEDLLYQAVTARGAWSGVFDEGALGGAAERLAALDLDALARDRAALKPMKANSVKAMLTRLENLVPEARTALATRDWGSLLACLDARSNVEVFRHFETVAALPTVAAVARPLQELARLAPDAMPTLDQAIAQRFLPLVETHLRARKLADGLYDYDDMIRAVDEGLQGASGEALSAKLRRRFKLALIDEAQDTEPAQWRIFRRVFLDSPGPHPVVLIGDPKQAIYSFRGADVHTYVKARQEIRARGGCVLALSRNHRSHSEVVAATNAILDHDADPRYFSGGDIVYDHPVSAAKPALGGGPGVTLFTAEATVVGGETAVPVRIGAIKQAMRSAIAAEIRKLRGAGAGAGAGASGPSLSEIHVLVRSNAEAREVAACLHEADIPNVLFRPDDIFKSAEATQVRALLVAIADPGDRAARLAAWLTPFFDVSLAELARTPDPAPDHPLMTRLEAWKALADLRSYDVLWGRILDDSGVARRLRLSSAGLRRLTNYRHLFDLLHARAASRPSSIADLAALLGALAAGHRRSSTGDDCEQRIETEADAVRIMTVHAAKGLEADFVFIYGGLTAPRIWRGVHAWHRDGERLICAGKPRRRELVDLIEADRHEEDQRLLYVAMTRARKHLYLPFFPAVEAGDPEWQGEKSGGGGGDFDPFSKITGEYRHVNQRLRALASEPRMPELFRQQIIPIDPEPRRDDDTALAAALAAWAPAGAAATDPDGPGEREVYASLRVRRRGFAITSYSRLSDAEGRDRDRPGPGDGPSIGPSTASTASTATAEAVEPSEGQSVEDARSLPRDALPGGIAAGLFLHAILEKTPLGELPPLDIWRELPQVRQLIEAEARRHDFDRSHHAEAARLVHAALTAPITLPDGSTLPGIARAARVRREVDFLFPLPQAASALAPFEFAASAQGRLVQERGFVRGALDVLFEQGGRVYFADWKSNVLDDFSSAALQAHVTESYELQVQIYTLGSLRLLGINDVDDYERHFGGLIYLFLRGLKNATTTVGGGASASASDGIYVRRPAYAEVERWTRELASRPVAGAGGIP
jgi:exodeoxyribonuclease V beta subunit